MNTVPSRCVRFRDSLPQDLIDLIDAAQSPVPLFSPTQVLLRTYSKNTNTPVQYESKIDTPNNCDMSSRENFDPQFDSSESDVTKTKLFHASPGLTTKRSSFTNSARAAPTVLSPINEDMFFSPAQTSRSLYELLTPNFIATPYKSLPKMEMISFNYIQQCMDSTTLHDIAHVLTKENRTPSLLRAVKSRLGELGATASESSNQGRQHQQSVAAVTTTQVQPARTQADALHYQPPLINKLPMQQNSSLLSPMDSIEGRTNENDEDESLAPEPLAPDSIQPEPLQNPQSTRTHAMDGKRLNDHASKVQQHGADAPPVMTAITNPSQTALHAEIFILTQKLANVQDMLYREQRKYQEQLELLESSKRESEQTIHDLQAHIKQSHLAQQALASAMTQLRNEKAQLNELMLRKQQTWVLRNQEQQELRKTLHDRLLALSVKLSSVETERDGLQRHNLKLNQSLEIAHRTLQEMKLEQEEVLRVVVDLIKKGANNMDFGSLTPDERKSIFSDLRAEMAATGGALRALKEGLITAEEDRARIVRTYHKTYALWKKAHDKSLRQERSNKDLINHVASLSKELLESQDLTAKIMVSVASVQHQKSWSELEAKYLQQIKSLKTRIADQESKVPFALYRNAVKEARTRTIEARVHREQADELNAKLAELQRNTPKLSIAATIPISCMKTTLYPLTTSLTPAMKKSDTQCNKQTAISLHGVTDDAKTTRRLIDAKDSENGFTDSEARSGCSKTPCFRRRMVPVSGGRAALKGRYRAIRSSARKPLGNLDMHTVH
ncbi:hypothetical protein MPSEU_000377100 [Mayamaea pseudoterrestris]|nr:hypothetical protein MPSEU_000377100 [Mayamaea pseudoterrestris]